jgi:phosphatidate cytidylyltransferase
MSTDPKWLWLVAGILIMLTTDSVIGYGLARRQQGRPSATITNLNSRIKAWWVMVVLIAIAFALGKTGVLVLFAFCSFAALREFITLTSTRRGDHIALATAFFIVLPLQYLLIGYDWYGLYSIFIPVYVFLGLPIIAALRGDTTEYISRIAEVQWGLMVSVFCVSHAPALLTLPIPGFEGQNAMLIVFLITVVQASDVLQYVWGKLIGRRKIAPRLSPSKTIEGFIGGVASATALGAALWWITPFTWWQAGLMALVVNLMGFCGGLVMSAIKRDRGVKDWGQMIEGHGGMLDRLDSVIFAAPVFFHLTRFWWAV